MKCVECNFEGPVDKFRYLYNARIDASLSMRQCPNCQTHLAIMRHFDKNSHKCSNPPHRRSIKKKAA